MQLSLFFQDVLPSWKSLRATRTNHIARGTMESIKRARDLSSARRGPVGYGCQDSHTGRYPAEDWSPEHDDRDYQEIDAEDIVTHVESGAIEGSLHRPPPTG